MKTMLLAVVVSGIVYGLCTRCVAAPIVPHRIAGTVHKQGPDRYTFTFDSEWSFRALPGMVVDICCDRSLADGVTTHTIIVEKVRVWDVCLAPNMWTRVTVSASAEQVEIMVEAAKRGQLRTILRASDDD